MSKPVDLLLAIIAHREISAMTVNSLERLRQAQLDFSYTLGEFVGDALLARARSQACSRFLLDTSIPYMLFIDSDIEFQPQDVSKIYHDLKDGYDVIGGIYSVRGASQLASYGWGGYLEVSGKIEEIEYLATGFMGISRRMLEKIRDELKLPYLNPKDWSKCYPFMEDGRTLRYEKLYKIVSDIFPKFSEHMMKQHLEELCRALGIRYRHQGDDIYISEDWDFPLVPETPILMQNFRWMQLGDIDVGDKVIGFGDARFHGRPYVQSQVVDKVCQKQELYRIITSEGDIISSSKHPFLASSPSGSATRWIPTWRLREGQNLNIPIRPYSNPILSSPQYMLGYIKGLWEGDGTIESHGYAVLEMSDKEPVERAHRFLNSLSLKVGDIKQRILRNPNWKPLWGFRCTQGVRDICNLPLSSYDMMRGFLAGIYDAEGSYHEGLLRIGNKSEHIAQEILLAFHGVEIPFGFGIRPDGLYEFGISNQKTCHKLWQLVSPSIPRKYSLNGQSGNKIMKYEKAEILSVEKMGKTGDVICLTTTSHNFIASGFASHNCDKVRKVGGKVYADTLVQVGHMREQVFSPMDVRNLQQKQKMDETVYGAINHQIQLSQKLDEDLAEYLGMTIPKAREKMVEGSATLARMWAEGKSEDFYKDNEEYVSQLSHFNSERMYFDSKVNQLVNISKQKILDIGCGIGTAVFMMAEQDNEVIGWDINKKVIEFAEFRKKKHNLKGEFTTEKPDFSQFDLIIAIDTLEHIENLREFLIDLGSKMKYGAKLYHVDNFLREGKYPMHYEEHAQHLSEWLKEAQLVEWDDRWAIRS